MLNPLVLTSDLVSFCHAGVDIILGSCMRDGSPICGLALGARLDPRTHSVRLILPRPGNAALLEAVGQGAAIAATFTQPTTHKSIQLKGPSARVGTARPEDKQRATEQLGEFCRELIMVGFPEGVARSIFAYDARDLVSLTFTPTEAFVQTPGPDAGNALKL